MKLGLEGVWCVGKGGSGRRGTIVQKGQKGQKKKKNKLKHARRYHQQSETEVLSASAESRGLGHGGKGAQMKKSNGLAISSNCRNRATGPVISNWKPLQKYRQISAKKSVKKGERSGKKKRLSAEIKLHT